MIVNLDSQVISLLQPEADGLMTLMWMISGYSVVASIGRLPLERAEII